MWSVMAVLVSSALLGCLDGQRTDQGSRAGAQAQALEARTEFARLVDRLSGPGGYFDTDNLISNESSYLHVMTGLENLGVTGGAYIGVGPDQNFSYIARIRPEIAFIVDIRRDNLLQQLMFKALFAQARNRIEYLCLLTGRRPPTKTGEWEERSVEDIVEYIDGSSYSPAVAEQALTAVTDQVTTFGIPLSEADLRTIRRFHGAFIRDGLDLRFQSHGRGPRSYYPTYRRLILERDLAGRRGNYLVSERDYQFVRELQRAHRVIPVVGDLAGDHALAEIARYLNEIGVPVSAFYTSNVEDYVWRAGRFSRFVRNLERLPYDERSVIVRSFFGRNFGYVHPQAVPGYHSVQLLGTITGLLAQYRAGTIRGYFDLVTGNVSESGRQQAVGQGVG